MHRTETSDHSETKISMRIDHHRKAVIARAAKIQHTSINEFVVQNAYQIASTILLEETSISLPEKQFEYILEKLDKPPLNNQKKMKKLLATKTVIDE